MPAVSEVNCVEAVPSKTTQSDFSRLAREASLMTGLSDRGGGLELTKGCCVF